ncbi:putative RNA polymerase sigma factor sigI [[Clostridium] ultunense Esp]|nr:putative RNA polymerase sigma factor sigI [[Clostridium] ultunense Esp]
MNEEELRQMIKKAKSGDQVSREKVLNHFRSFVLNVASRITHRFLTWSDDESSIGLNALNKAIDHYDEKMGKHFLSYSYLLISRELIDFFRKERKFNHLSLEEGRPIDGEGEEGETSPYEWEEALRRHQWEEGRAELIQEILLYESELEKYHLSFHELPDISPKHKDTRQNCFKLAQTFVASPELVEKLRKKRRLPIADLARYSGTPTKTIEKNRKYILAVIILLLHPDLERLKEYIRKGGDET